MDKSHKRVYITENEIYFDIMGIHCMNKRNSRSIQFFSIHYYHSVYGEQIVHFLKRYERDNAYNILLGLLNLK